MRNRFVLGGLAALAGILGVFGLVWLIADTDESAGPENGVTLNDVVDDPARHEGRTVVISGEWADNGFLSPDDAGTALVIGDDADETLLVIPEPGVEVPRLGEDTVVRVEGTVEVLEPDGSNGTTDLLRQGGLLSRDGPEAIVEASAVELVDPPRATNARDRRFTVATVGQILADPGAFDRRAVTVPGRARRVGDGGFVLQGQDASIFVGAPASDLEQLEAGERVRVRADVAELSPFGSRQRERAFASVAPGVDPQEEVDLSGAPFEPGDPYLLLRALDGQGAGDPAPRGESATG